MWLSLSYMFGVWLAARLNLAWGWWGGVAGIGFVLFVLPRLLSRLSVFEQWRQLWVNAVLLCLLALGLGGVHYQRSLPEITPAHLAWYNDLDSALEITGVVTRPPKIHDSYVQIEIRAEQVVPEGEEARQVTGRMLARLPAKGDWQYGDRVRLWGLLETPPEDEDFSYKDYLARQRIYSYMPYAGGAFVDQGNGNLVLRWLYGVRQKGMALVYHYLPDPEASLLAGIVLGVESGIPNQVSQDFQETGTTHIIAISGFNITVVSGLFAMLFGRLLGPRRGAVVALMAISFYTVLVGGDAPVVRAAIMGGISLFARQVGRRQHGLNSLAFSAALMTIGNPNVLWDVGFQLSFAATLGLVLYAEPWGQVLGDWLEGRLPLVAAKKLTGWISEYFLLTLAAQLTTLPLLVYYFHRFSIISLPANLAILPAQPPVMIVGGLSVLLGLVVPALGQWAAYVVWPFLTYTIRVVAWFASFSEGSMVLGWFHPLWVVGFYTVLLGLTFSWDQIQAKVKQYREGGKLRLGAVLLVLGVLTVLVWQAALAAPDGKLHVTFLDVGDGEAVLLQTPEGRYLLVGGGESAVQLSYGLGRRLPLFHRQLDVLVVAGTEKAQINALPDVVERFPPGQVWWAGEPGESRPGRELYAWVRENHVPLERMAAGQVLALGGGAQLEVVGVSQGGAVLLLSWSNFHCLLPVGALPEDLTTPEVQQALKRANIVLLPGSGDAERNPAGWLDAAAVRAAVLSVDALNRYGLPDGEVLAQVAGTQILRTDQYGWIEIVTDGQQLWVQVEDPN